MKNWINYHHLLYFKIIAEEQSVSKAAVKLSLSQSTLSAQLKQFEETMGIKLFERFHKKLVLTEQGNVTLDYARNIFNMGNELYEVLHDRIIPSRLSLKIGALDSVPKQVILQITKAAYNVEKCNVSLIEGRSDEIFRELMAHHLDLVITNHIPTSVQIKSIMHRVLSDKMVAISGASKFKKLRKGFPESIKGQPFIMPTYDSQLRYDMEHWLKVRSIEIDPVAESQDVALKKLMATEGLGLIPAAPYAVSRQVLSGELFEIGKLDAVGEVLYLVTAQRKIANPIARDLFKSFKI